MENELHFLVSHFQARLPAEQGALVMKALELAMERRQTDLRAALRANEESPGKSARPPLEPFDASRADALVEIAESYLNHGATSASTADRYQVVVHVSAETRRLYFPIRQHQETQTPKVKPIPEDTKRFSFCDRASTPLWP